jgi:GDP-L-fucose synthase
LYANKRVLVTGATGLIGRELVRLLVEAGARVRAACYHEPIDPEPGVEYFPGDLRDGNYCRQIVRGCHYVFHLASIRGSVGLGRRRAADFFVPLLLMNTHMMEEARKAGVERYLFASSVCVYAPAKVFSEDEAWKQPPHPSDAFAGWAKRMGELQADAYREQYGWDQIAIVRPVNTYGPYDDFDAASAQVIPALIARVESGENPLRVWGDGSAVRDFLYSTDAAHGILLALERYACGQPVNLGSGRGYSIREVVDAVLQASGRHPTVEWDRSKPTGEPYRVADLTRARTELGFEPRVGLAEGVAHTLEWYRANRPRVWRQRSALTL